MAQKSLELILARQLSSYLVMPIFLVDPQGNLLFYNEPAEQILGRHFEETGEMRVNEWSVMFNPTDEDGSPMNIHDLPLVIALAERRPAQRRIWIRGLDNVNRQIDVIAFPLQGQAERFLGAIAILWEIQD